jgi:hypothetical protein
MAMERKYLRTANRALGRFPEFLVLLNAGLDLNCSILADSGSAAPHNNFERNFMQNQPGQLAASKERALRRIILSARTQP